MQSPLQKELVLERHFETQDIQLAATMMALGLNLVAIDRNNPTRCSFVFDDSDNLRQCVGAFWCKELSIEPQALLSALKGIKSRLYGDRP